MIAVVDYGAGNLFSVHNALAFLGIAHRITGRIADIEAADGIILPGVGAFPQAMAMLDGAGLTPVLKAQAQVKPFLGICLGMQLLFDFGYEFTETAGLGLIPGTVTPLVPQTGIKIPHMGWNSVKVVADCPLSAGIEDGDYVYYVHSYVAQTAARYCSLMSDYGQPVPGLVYAGHVYGAQFHPEKSGAVGMQILKKFGGLVT